jgi:hypothetical protein
MNAPTRSAEAGALAAFAEEAWDTRIVPAVTDYIAVPAKSPMFDAKWAEHGLLDRVVTDAAPERLVMRRMRELGAQSARSRPPAPSVRSGPPSPRSWCSTSSSR